MLNLKTDKKQLQYLVLKYFQEGARTTNFYQNEMFEGYETDEVKKMLYALVNTNFVERIGDKSTNGAAYSLTKDGEQHLERLEADGYRWENAISQAV